MVFCGKPSKGCAECRKRRIKCDQLDPACSQCKRASKECSGYRDQLTLLFRDESAKVVRKARFPSSTAEKRKSPGKFNGSNKSSPASSVSTSPGSLETLANGELTDSPWTFSLVSNESTPLSSPMPLCIDDLGIHFFFTHYMTVVSKPSPGNDNPTSSPIWPELYVDKTFYDAVSSVGFAGLSNVTKDRNHMTIARHKYVTTLRRINAALQDPDSMCLRGIFKAVLLLAAFEVVGGNSPASWGVHIDGGAALLQTFGKNAQPKEPRLRMLLQFCFSTCIKSLGRNEPAPTAIVEWCQLRRGCLSDSDQHAFPLIDIACRFVNLYSAIKKDWHSNAETNLEELLALEAELESWESHAPENWKFTVEPRPAGSEEITFNGQLHVYRDLWTARVYGNYRWARILTNELIWVQISKLSSFSVENEIQQRRSLEVISKMATDICCSVSGQVQRHTIAKVKLNKIPPVSPVFILLFPLAVAAGAFGVSEELHNWAIKILFIIGNTMGIRQALLSIPIAKKHRQHWQKGELEEFFIVT